MTSVIMVSLESMLSGTTLLPNVRLTSSCDCAFTATVTPLEVSAWKPLGKVTKIGLALLSLGALPPLSTGYSSKLKLEATSTV